MKNFIKKYHKTSIFLAYLILTLVLTYPVVFKITSEIPAVGSDAFQILRRFNLLENKINHFFQPEKYPARIIGETNFENQSMRNFFLWLVMPFPLVFGNALGYNIIWLLSFALAGFGMFLLADFFIDDKKIAFLAGFIYSFSAYHFIHGAGHFYTMHIEWIPFYFLFLFKFIKSPNIKNGSLTLLFFILLGATDAQYLILSAILTALIAIYYLIRKPTLMVNKKLIGIATATTIIALLVLYFQYSAYLGIAGGEENFLKPNFEQVKNYSADFVSIFTPSHLHPFWGDFFYQQVSRYFTGNIFENTIFPGFLVMILALYGFLYASKEKNIFFIFWGIIFLIFFLVSLGPFLNIMGKSQSFNFPLPYFLFYKIVPFFDHSRTVSRNFIMALLALVILASYGLKNFPKPIIRKNLFFYIFSALIFIEFLSFPYPTRSIAVPKIYKEIMSDKNNFKVMEIPSSLSQDAYSEALYYETFYQKEIVGGLPLTRKGERNFDFEKKTPVIAELLGETFEKPLPENDIFSGQNYKDIAENVFTYYNIKYIILHKNYLDGKKIEKLSKFIEKNLKTEKKESGTEILFKVVFTENPKVFLKRGDLKIELLEKNEIKGAMENGQAEIIVENPGQKTNGQLFFRVDLEEGSFLKLFAKEKNILEAKVSSKGSWFSQNIEIEQGENKFLIEIEPVDQKVYIFDVNLRFPLR